ncbi:TPA: hypothetical protein PJH80_002760 [Raoultella ornithinolytica]|nr:hypothetical protein [Raoultella ornithinolytica]
MGRCEDIWANLVDIVLPKVLAYTAEERAEQQKLRAEQALLLAAAALHAAGEHALAENLLD